ncbi:PDDEXK nuclease domain-containing protein [Deefgea salmonis]|uniref:PDDEXK nuclease domain-containing protein n=1 Tax=Deefgea salmonis TaxID=2875502 RepID=A0ABS8BJ07_9NEIS|nr:PDDEXK nuclease domain-containing protein [Deefgea salmonis]MCB5195699.1 PDDEXK nuclease domain-containing protein [Deefgea salmonis]
MKDQHPQASGSLDDLLLALSESHTQLQQQAARSVDLALVARNWIFGWHIVEFEHGAAGRVEMYGKRLLDDLAQKLTEKLGAGFSKRTLEQCRRFYLNYRDIAQTLSAQSLPASPADTVAIATLLGRFRLGWSHYVALLTLKNADERRFYEIEAINNSWGVRELQRQMASLLYERLALSRNPTEVKALAQEGHVITKAADVLKNPYVLEFLNLPEHHAYSEHELETAIIDQLQLFLLELGKGFLFEARQKRFTFEDDHFYVDLVFYNRLLRCYVLIDLKRDKLTHQDLGQMQMYVNYFDRFVKRDDENATIGIILCKQKNDALVEITLPKDANIHASEYQLYLPSKEELQQRLNQWGTLTNEEEA